jgi:hypothetical protein
MGAIDETQQRAFEVITSIEYLSALFMMRPIRMSTFPALLNHTINTITFIYEVSSKGLLLAFGMNVSSSSWFSTPVLAAPGSALLSLLR